MFLSIGIPVRATLTVTFKEYITPEQQILENPLQSADHTKKHLVMERETLSSIAAQEYGDPKQWRPIAKANNIDNPKVLETGQLLTIPPLQK
jgi:nucleoid-associated protein YgaU